MIGMGCGAERGGNRVENLTERRLGSRSSLGVGVRLNFWCFWTQLVAGLIKRLATMELNEHEI